MRRFALVAVTPFAMWLLAAAVSYGQHPSICDVAGEAPDVTVSDIGFIQAWGSLDGTSSFSIATEACNIGTCRAEWDGWTNRHPVIAQNMYRIRDGRLEQIGQSWLKHSFLAFSLPGCASGCVDEPSGSYLGVNCSDPYGGQLNGFQELLGPRYQVNAFTGEYPYPHAARDVSGDVIYKRLQVDNDDLDPDRNPGATYFFEAQYIAPDDAEAGRSVNNASTQRATVTEIGLERYEADVFGLTFRGTDAPTLWRFLDATVSLDRLAIPGEGRVSVAARSEDLGNGRWRYVYVVHNLNSHRGVRSISVPIPRGAAVDAVGFNDVDYHSGEIQDGVDWKYQIGAEAITWSTTPHDVEPAANAIRWGTAYTFWFDAAAPPADTHVTLGLFVPGSPSSITARVPGPSTCNGNGTCDPGEACDTCPSDCAVAGACCGDGTCDEGESTCSCAADCGLPSGHESSCVNGSDDDCDGLIDCVDGDCCGLGDCGTETDTDADTVALCDDCNDGDPTSWETPGEVPAVSLSKTSGATIRWEAPLVAGGSQTDFFALRTQDASSFIRGTTCLASADGQQVVDQELPPPGKSFFYLLRAINGCRRGRGGLGVDSAGLERVGRDCSP